eukprot:267728_1
MSHPSSNMSLSTVEAPCEVVFRLLCRNYQNKITKKQIKQDMMDKMDQTLKYESIYCDLCRKYDEICNPNQTGGYIMEYTSQCEIKNEYNNIITLDYNLRKLQEQERISKKLQKVIKPVVKIIGPTVKWSVFERSDILRTQCTYKFPKK